MAIPRGVIFDLGGTLVHWSDWDTGADAKWAASYDHLVTQFADRRWPARDAYVMAMREAEREHWKRVDTERWSGPPTGLVRAAFDRLGVPVSGAELLGAMDGYAKAIAGWSAVDPDAVATLTLLRERGYRLGLLSNPWWAADWHNADPARGHRGSRCSRITIASGACPSTAIDDCLNFSFSKACKPGSRGKRFSESVRRSGAHSLASTQSRSRDSERARPRGS